GLDTKCPSITSRWSRRAPPCSTRAISSARRAKSAERIEGTISIICGPLRFYHGSIETVPGFASRKPLERRIARHRLVLLPLKRAGGVHQDSPGGEQFASIRQERYLQSMQALQVGRREPPLDIRVSRQRTGAGAGGVDQNAVE